MKSIPVTLLLCGLTLLASACSRSDESASATTTNAKSPPPAEKAEKAEKAAPAAAPAAPAGVEVSPEMKAFMGMLDGKDASASNALKKYGIKGLKDADLGGYTLKDPKVVKSEKVGALNCYTMITAAGMMKHTSKLCWNATGKIAEVTDTSE